MTTDTLLPYKGINALPALWQALAAELTDLGGILAGGALRDINAGLEVSTIKDIDFFVPFDTDRELVNNLLALYGWNRVTRECRDYFMPGSSGDIYISVEYAHRFSTEFPAVNVIWMSEGFTPASTLERYDFGACQIIWDGQQLVWTEAFEKDMDSKTFTLIRSESQQQYDRSMQRVTRWTTSKYSDWSVDISNFTGEFSAAADADDTLPW